MKRVPFFKTCEGCKKTFRIKPSHAAGTSNCSRACRWTKSLAERFWEKVSVGEANACWEWTSHRDKDWGYGKFQIGKKSATASRVSYELSVGAIPPGLKVLHKCDNPPCVNPAHLFLGTDADNVADKMAKGRHRALSGNESPSAKLSSDDVRWMRWTRDYSGATYAAIAQPFGVAMVSAHQAINGRNWGHV